MTIPIFEEVAGLIDDSVALLERDGWAQGWMQDPEGRRCLRGAIETVVEMKGLPLSQERWRVRIVISAIADSIIGGDSIVSDEIVVTNWNDAVGRTEQQALDLLCATAKRQRIFADQAGGAS